MRFDRHFTYDDFVEDSFHKFIEKIKDKYPNEEIIGYRAIKEGTITKVAVTFVRKENTI